MANDARPLCPPPCPHPKTYTLPLSWQIARNSAGFWGGGVLLGGSSYSSISSCSTVFEGGVVQGNTAQKGGSQVGVCVCMYEQICTVGHEFS